MLDKTDINVMTRLMGLILAALAVEVMADGLGKLFPVLAHHELSSMPAANRAGWLAVLLCN